MIASGSTPLSYQWHKDGVPIHGALMTLSSLKHISRTFRARIQWSCPISNGSCLSSTGMPYGEPAQGWRFDFSFVWGSSINGDVSRCVAVQPAGKILIGGDFPHRAPCRSRVALSDRIAARQHRLYVHEWSRLVVSNAFGLGVRIGSTVHYL